MELAKKMLKDHGKLQLMIKKVSELIEDLPSAKLEFEAFKWHFEKHMFVEDSAIFSIFERIDSKDTSKIFDLMEQHAEIQNLLKNIEKDFKNNTRPNLEKIKNLIDNHIKIENESFYPSLDKNLGEIEKISINQKIDELIL